MSWVRKEDPALAQSDLIPQVIRKWRHEITRSFLQHRNGSEVHSCVLDCQGAVLSCLSHCLPPTNQNWWPPPCPQPFAQAPQTPLPQNCPTAARICMYIFNSSGQMWGEKRISWIDCVSVWIVLLFVSKMNQEEFKLSCKMQWMLLSSWSPGRSPLHQDDWLSSCLIKILHFPHHTGTFSSRGQVRCGGHEHFLLQSYFLFHHGIFQRGKSRVKIDLSCPAKACLPSSVLGQNV